MSHHHEHHPHKVQIETVADLLKPHHPAKTRHGWIVWKDESNMTTAELRAKIPGHWVQEHEGLEPTQLGDLRSN